MTASIYETLSYYPAGTHIVVEAPGLEPMLVEQEQGLSIRVNGRACPVQAVDTSTAAAVRAALTWADEATDWSEGTEAWDETSYASRGPILAPSIDGDVSETAEEWYDALGYSTGADGHYSHPVCAMDDVDSYDPEADVDGQRSRDDSAAEAAEARRDLHAYAQRARDAAVSIRASIDAAVAAHGRGDVAGVLSALTDAYREEREWGDWPSTRAAAESLLGDGWTVSLDSHGSSLVHED